jgi:hypothetical protein
MTNPTSNYHPERDQIIKTIEAFEKLLFLSIENKCGSVTITQLKKIILFFVMHLVNYETIRMVDMGIISNEDAKHIANNLSPLNRLLND